MFMIVHTSELEVASIRARLRWADAIDDLLAVGETGAAAAMALASARAELTDLGNDLSHDDLRRLARVVRSHRDASRASVQVATR